MQVQVRPRLHGLISVAFSTFCVSACGTSDPFVTLSSTQLFDSSQVVKPFPVTEFVGEPTEGSQCGLRRATYYNGVLTQNILAAEGPSVLEGGGRSVFVVPKKLQANTDGSPRSYSPFHPSGRGKPDLGNPYGVQYAFNHLCNGGVRVVLNGKRIRCLPLRDTDPPGTPPPDMQRYLTYYRAVRDNGWMPTDVTNFERQASGETSFFGLFTQKSIAEVEFSANIFRVNKKRACIRKTGRYAGYFVNLVALDSKARQTPIDPEDESDDGPECNYPILVDAEKVPGLVIPQIHKNNIGDLAGARVGDVVVAYNPRNKLERRWLFAVVSDAGPSDKFGEASIAFNREINGRPADWSPKDYTDLIDRGTVRHPVPMLLLPGTSEAFGRNYSLNNIQKISSLAFAKWGGWRGDENVEPSTDVLQTAKERFLACAKAIQ